MGLFRYSRGLIDKAIGARKRSAVEKNGELIDPMQRFTTIGEYHVGASDGTPGGQDYVLTVYKMKKELYIKH